MMKYINPMVYNFISRYLLQSILSLNFETTVIFDLHLDTKSRRGYNFHRYADWCLSVVQLYINAVTEICIIKTQPLVISNRNIIGYYAVQFCCKTRYVHSCCRFPLICSNTFYFSLSFCFFVRLLWVLRVLPVHRCKFITLHFSFSRASSFLSAQTFYLTETDLFRFGKQWQ